MLQYWQLIIFICFCTNAVLSINFIFRFSYEEKPKSSINYLIMCINVSSAIWSIGMGMMSIQTIESRMYFWRMFGIFGTFMFMISVQKLMCMISEIPKKAQIIINGISYLGLFVFLLYLQPSQTIFVQNRIGVTFYFKSGIVNIIYALYFLIVSINIFLVTIYMAKNHVRKQVRVAAKRFIIVEWFVFFGSIFDMIIPVHGLPAIPGSAITHFWGVFILWYAIHQMYRSQITIKNMSEYIYYSLDTPVLVLDSHKKIHIMNDAASLLLHAAHSDTVKDYDELPRFFEIEQDMIDFDGKSVVVEARCVSNQKNFDLSISKIYDAYHDIIGYIILLNDLTEHELVISKLEQAKLAADSANMSKSLFLANMSHEMRTPLNAILGFSDIALMNDMDQNIKTYFEHIKSAGETLLSVINQVLNISKIELGKQELSCKNYHPARIFKDVELITDVQAKKKGLDFQMNIAPDFPIELYGDKDKIREILLNILNNSVKYTKNGSVTIDIGIESKQEDEVIVCYKITDTGIGIKKEDLASIFERFKRVDDKFNTAVEGTGLGLSITKGLVTLMSGEIHVESVYGTGTTFTVTIPQKVVDSSPIHAEEDKVTSDFSNHTVPSAKGNDNLFCLAVDDNEINLMVVSGILSELGIKHDTATNGFDAIEMCKNTVYDVILLDQMMPEIDGIETLHRIKLLPAYQKKDTCKIIVLTANVIEGAEDELLAQGFDFYLAKPIDIDLFQKTIFSIKSE